VSLDTRQHLHAGAAFREILFNPGVPALEVALRELIEQRTLLIVRQALNRVLDLLDVHR